MGRRHASKAPRPARTAAPPPAPAVSPDDAVRIRGGRIIVAAGFCASLLIAAPLYLTQRGYPLAPVLDALPAVPPPVDHLLLGALVLALAGVAIVPQPRAWVWTALALAAVLAVGDQSRWQPWCYQYALMLGLLGLARSKTEALSAWRFVLVALYVWGGLQKLNWTFVAQVFPWMIEPVSGARPDVPGPMLLATGVAVALIEVGVGLALLSPTFRAVGVAAAIGTHGLVLVLLGPLGHTENHVVWPWNIALALLVGVLFWRATAPARDIVIPRRLGGHAAVLVLAGILPALSFGGVWDAYLSGALYSGNTRAGVLVMTERTAERLPVAARPHVTKSPDNARVLHLFEWSVAELGAPSYPETRVFRRIAAELCRQAGAPPDMTLVIFERPALRNGERSATRESCAALISP